MHWYLPALISSSSTYATDVQSGRHPRSRSIAVSDRFTAPGSSRYWLAGLVLMLGVLIGTSIFG